MTKPTRIAVINSHPIQYFAPLYAYLNSAPDVEVTALYLSDFSLRGGKDVEFGREVKWNVDLLAGYRSVFLGARANRREPRGFWSLIVPEVWAEVRSGRYDVIWLHGHNYAANILALLAAKMTGLPVVMRGDTHLGLPRGGLKGVLRRPLMNMLYAMCDGLLAVGTANADYYRAMGVPERKIFLVPYTVDNDRFVKDADQARLDISTVRKGYNLSLKHPVILFAAKLISRKRPGDVLEAARRLHTEADTRFSVVIAGTGEMEQELKQFCFEHALKNVVFIGFVNQSELPAIYAAADIFVLPSEDEPWGLAVNEAMCARLPVVVSAEVGCVPDLVEHGVNGFTPAAGDVEGLTSALRSLLQSQTLRQQQGEASLNKIMKWSYRESLNGIREALTAFKNRDASAAAHGS